MNNFVFQIDIDECKEVNDCHQKCINTRGSYTCSCNEGFSSVDNGMNCTGKITTNNIFIFCLTSCYIVVLYKADVLTKLFACTEIVICLPMVLCVE